MNIIRKVYGLMHRRLPKNQGKIPASIKLIGTVYKTVEDAETAFKEANAARLALAKYKQIKRAFDDDDLGTVATLLNSVRDDDDSAGAALLRAMFLELRENKQRGSFFNINKKRKDTSDAKAGKWRKIADDLGLDWASTPYAAAEVVKPKISQNGEPSVKTIARAFGAK